jgi:hypothetical protein
MHNYIAFLLYLIYTYCLNMKYNKSSLHIFCVLLFLSGTLPAQNLPVFKGKIKKSVYYFYGPNLPFRAEAWQFMIDTEYDINGREIKSTFSSKDNSKDTVIAQDFTHYDETGRRVMIVRPLSHDTSRIIYVYNKNHHLVETYYMSIGKGPTQIIVHDEKKQVDTLYRDGRSKPQKITRHINKFQDEEISFYREQVAPSVNGSKIDTAPVAHKSVITFDKNRNKTDERRYNPRGELDDHLTFTYDRDGNRLTTIDSSWRKDEGRLENKRKLAYVNKGAEKYKKVDKAGNWLELYTLVGDKFFLHSRRELEYYP